MGEPKYKRVVLKLSGEALQGSEKALSINPEVVAQIAARIKAVVDMGTQVGIVCGGGNIFRGVSGAARGIDRTSGDHMGMLATIINGLALQNALEHQGVPTRLQTAIAMPRIAESFILKRALRHFEKGRVCIFAGGTGNPYFSTDTAAALRASEIGADLLLKATKVDGVYSADPMKNSDATCFSHITYDDALAKSLKVMDAAAFSLCRDNNIPIIVLNFSILGSLERAVAGESVGTLVSKTKE